MTRGAGSNSRDLLRNSYDQFLKAAGWSAVIVGLALLGVSVAFNSGYSPFHHPGAPPATGEDVKLLLQLDSVRWLATAIAGSLCGVRRAPRRRNRYQPGPGAAVAVPLAVLMGVVVMGVISTVCWFFWMKHLPGGDRMHNALLCAGYLAIPAALLLTFAATLFTRPAAR
jgi:hypothetical protein